MICSLLLVWALRFCWPCDRNARLLFALQVRGVTAVVMQYILATYPMYRTYVPFTSGSTSCCCANIGSRGKYECKAPSYLMSCDLPYCVNECLPNGLVGLDSSSRCQFNSGGNSVVGLVQISGTNIEAGGEKKKGIVHYRNKKIWQRWHTCKLLLSKCKSAIVHMPKTV